MRAANFDVNVFISQPFKRLDGSCNYPHEIKSFVVNHGALGGMWSLLMDGLASIIMVSTQKPSNRRQPLSSAWNKMIPLLSECHLSKILVKPLPFLCNDFPKDPNWSYLNTYGLHAVVAFLLLTAAEYAQEENHFYVRLLGDGGGLQNCHWSW